ncbi:MAG: Ig-like domain-containing protein, partial [Euryarchaeota archaeon]|nr:Ig-like domain-containing protein [Euryarchaeota archaeon]
FSALVGGPWSWSFNFPNGAGWYRFYTLASDNASNQEAVPVVHDALCGCEATTPVSNVNMIAPYLFNTASMTIDATASDAGGSGIQNVSLYYRFSANNATWGAWTWFSADASAPYSYSFNWPSGSGYYEFYSVAIDNAGNIESAPTSADTKAMYDSTAPTIVTTTPADDGINISTDAGTYVIHFSEAMNTSAGTVQTNLPGISWAWSADKMWYNGTYTTLQASTMYYVNLTGHTDLAGNALSGDANKAFTTAISGGPTDTTAPTIISTTPSDSATGIATSAGTCVIHFSEAMNTSAGTVETNLPGVSWAWSADKMWYNGTYTTLQASTTYYVNLTGYTDLAGNALSGDANKAFTTASTAIPGTVVGRVTDTNGNPIASAAVSISGTNLQTSTNESGYFSLANVPAGNHDLVVSHANYVTKTTPITVSAGQTTTANVQLTADIEPAFDWLWIILIIVVVMVAIGILVILMRRRSKGQQDAPKEPGEPEPTTTPTPQPVAPAEPTAPAPAAKPSTPAPVIQAAQPPAAPGQMSNEDRIARLKKALEEGRISKEFYEANIKKFTG